MPKRRRQAATHEFALGQGAHEGGCAGRTRRHRQRLVKRDVALAVDHCFSVLQLHRIEVNIRPENGPSLRVVEKLGLRDEGLRERYLHIQGRWCDHRTFALTAEEVPGGLLARWQATREGR